MPERPPLSRILHSIGRIALAALPFFVLMCIGVAIVTLFPQIALWLPDALFTRPAP